jgi:SAM-dependent methyltransferase
MILKHANKKVTQYWNQRHQSGPWKSISGISNFREYLHTSQRVIELGCGPGPDIKPPGIYIGLDLAIQGLKKRRNMENAVCCDVSMIPLEDKSADLVFSNDVLEHIPQPQKVIEECCRILKPGGIIIHRDAWFSRKWRAEGLFTKSNSPFPLRTLLKKLLVKIMEIKFIRWPKILLTRIIREFRWRLFSSHYKKLEYDYFTPNLSEYLESDSDACVSIDPHALILLYLSKGFDILRTKGLWGRLQHRKHIIVKKVL